MLAFFFQYHGSVMGMFIQFRVINVRKPPGPWMKHAWALLKALLNRSDFFSVFFVSSKYIAARALTDWASTNGFGSEAMVPWFIVQGHKQHRQQFMGVSENRLEIECLIHEFFLSSNCFYGHLEGVAHFQTPWFSCPPSMFTVNRMPLVSPARESCVGSVLPSSTKDAEAVESWLYVNPVQSMRINKLRPTSHKMSLVSS